MTPEEYNEQRELLLRKQSRLRNSPEWKRLQSRIDALDQRFERSFYGHQRREKLECELPLHAFGVV